MDNVDEAIGLTNLGACPDCGKTYNLGNISEAANLTCKQCNFTGGLAQFRTQNKLADTRETMDIVDVVYELRQSNTYLLAIKSYTHTLVCIALSIFIFSLAGFFILLANK